MSIEPCSCATPGFCPRHGVAKSDHWHRLCTTRVDYRKLWDDGIGPGQRIERRESRGERIRSKRKAISQSAMEQGRQAWKALHTYSQEAKWNPAVARDWYYSSWRPIIPQFGCQCRRHWRNLELEHPPDFSTEERFILWGFERHNDVNRLLGRDAYDIAVAWRDRHAFFRARS